MYTQATYYRNRGAALVVSLIILLVMTLIGVTSVQTTTLEEKMAGNMRDVNLGFQSAEAGLRDGELFLQAASLPMFNNTNGLYQPTPVDQTQRWETVNWSTGARAYSGSALSYVKQQPTYIIEEMPAVSGTSGSLAADKAAEDVGYYRITARAVGGTLNAVVILQTTYKR